MIIYWSGFVDRHAQMVLSDSLLGVWSGGGTGDASVVGVIDVVGAYHPTITVTGEYRPTLDVVGVFRED